jgi:hypothetical protein
MASRLLLHEWSDSVLRMDKINLMCTLVWWHDIEHSLGGVLGYIMVLMQQKFFWDFLH